MQRRELFSFLSTSLKGESSREEAIVIRPPYYRDITAFDTECQKCDGKCATLCQEQIIIIAEDKTPILNIKKSGCTYCDDCAVGCEYDVLFVDSKRDLDVDVIINEKSCVSWSGVMCFSCKDPCLEDAIEFKAMFMPTIDQSKCNSCGFCISRCPTLAIDIFSLKEEIDSE